jgi:hypothetical protein
MNKNVPDKSEHLSKIISVKSAELTNLCLKKVSLLDPEVYSHSLELDELVVKYMKSKQKKQKKK